jgi:hypothetical protein
MGLQHLRLVTRCIAVPLPATECACAHVVWCGHGKRPANPS